ncbi:TetR/AcrR family transcriptional regulator [Streptomyces sp. NPDC093085]|uniref:TetR/AcrR family transcriptional regulator n=1 Tax=Streptomyces sp. NPDC093085 TaxID=3155068 RepID=UPI0034399499
MPSAREALLSAAQSALADQPWSAVRMVDVAAAGGVSRQTLYNEFGSKDGLARALVRREADRYLHGVERLLRERADAADRLVAVAEWTVGEARARPLLRALLTGCWGEWLPAPRPVKAGAPQSGIPAQRRADAGPPATTELVALVRDRSAAALDPSRKDHGRPEHGRAEPGRTDGARGEHGRGEHGHPGHLSPVGHSRFAAYGRTELLYRCELAMRLALAHLVAPGAEPIGPLVRTAVTASPSALLSAPSPRAGAR